MIVEKGSNVTISCGHQCPPFPVKWIINGTIFNQSEVLDSPLYRLNYPLSTTRLSLTLLSINGNTTIQCIVGSTTSTLGTITVTSMYTYVCV